MITARDLRWLFVCRGSAEDGLGHVIRTRALLERLPAETVIEVMVIGDDLVGNLLHGLAVPITIVPDESPLAQRVAEFAPDVLVFDMIPLSGEAFDACRDRALTVSVSPIFDHLDAVDLVFNRTRYDSDGQVATAANRRYGTEWAIVRPECQIIDSDVYSRQLREETLSIAISMGGADAPNRTLQVVEALRSLEAPATFWVLLGEGYAHSYEELAKAVTRDRRHEVILAKTNRSMWRILRNCSLAVLAGGVTTYEAAFAGLPSINVLAEHQAFLIRELVERGAAADVGTLASGAAERTRQVIEQLERERDRLLELHFNSRRLVDGLGGGRILAEIARSVAAARSREVVAR